MKKNSIINIVIIAMFSVAFISCGDEGDDPKSKKTNLELVKEGILGQWTYVSAEITINGVTKHYSSGECKNSSVGNVAVDVDYIFKDTPQVNVSQNSALVESQNCTFNVYPDKGYFVTESGDIIMITIYGGANVDLIYTLLTKPEDISGNTVKVKSTLNGTERVVTFIKN